jgi:hypothetical protein
MSRFSAAQREGILAEARANIAARATAERESTSSRQPEIIYKRRDDAVAGSPPAHAPSERGAAVESGSELSWWQWVDARIESRLELHGEAVGTAIGDFCGPELAAMRREIKLLQREITQLREQIGIERGLQALRDEIEAAKSEVPRVPEIAARLEKEQVRLRCELERTQKRVSRARVDQSIADFKLNELGKQIESRSTAMEMKFETTVASFKMNEIHPDAGRALRSFADEALKGRRGETDQAPLSGPGGMLV